MNINIEKLEAAIAELKGVLKDSLIITSIWDFSTGLALAELSPQPAAVALFTEVTRSLAGTLYDSGFPELNRYYLIDLADDHLAMVVRHGDDLLQGVVMSAKKVNLGVLISIALPKMIASVEAARG